MAHVSGLFVNTSNVALDASLPIHKTNATPTNAEQDEAFIKAKGYFDLGMYAQSYIILQELSLKHTDNEMVCLYLAYSAFFTDRREEAVHHFTLLKSSAVHSQIRAICFNAIGIINFDEHQYDHARRAFSQALKEDANLFAAYYNLGMVHYVEGNYKEAITEWENYLQLTKDEDLELFLYLSSCYLKLGQYALAMDIVQRMIPQNHEQVLLQLGKFYEDINKHEEAIACYKNLLKQNPKHCEALHGIGWNQWLIHAENEQSIPLLKKALSIQQDNTNIAFSLAWIYFHKGLTVQSEKINQWLLSLDPSSPVGTALAVLIAMRKGDNQHAEAEISLLREQKEIRNRALGDLLFGKLKLQQHVINEAIEAFSRSAHSNPHLQDSYLMQGIAYYLNNEIEKASIVLKKQQFIV